MQSRNESPSLTILPSSDNEKICFFISNIDTPYEGMVRPFINWTIELRLEGYEIYFILLNCSKKLKDFLEKYVHGVNLKSVTNFNEMLTYLYNSRPTVIVTDDYYARLRLINKIKNITRVRTCIYVQVLHGIHSIVDTFNLNYASLKFKLKIRYFGQRFIPFNFLRRPYKNLLLNQDLIIANSQTTATFLHTLYGIEPDEVIHPPVNTNIFKTCAGKKNQVLLYLGSHSEEVDANFIRKICEILQTGGFNILVFGNVKISEQMKNDFNLQYCSDVCDEELARIYSESKFTICPQKWEMFGYVAAESISCGTPAIAFNLMGFAEIIAQPKCGYLVNNKQEFLTKVESLTLESKNKCDRNTYFWNIETSTMKLKKVIESN